MAKTNWAKELPQYGTSYINYKSRQMIGCYGFTASDLDDIRQEIAIDLFQRLLHYDPERASLKTFINRVVDHKIASIIEARSCPTRDYTMCMMSLDQSIESEDGSITPFGDLVAGMNDWPGNSDLRVDISRAVSKLTPEQQRLCKMLSLYDKTHAARTLGISRDTLYRTRSEIREVFKVEGLDVYAQNCLPRPTPKVRYN